MLRYGKLKPLFIEEYLRSQRDTFPNSQLSLPSKVLPRPWLLPLVCPWPTTAHLGSNLHGMKVDFSVNQSISQLMCMWQNCLAKALSGLCGLVVQQWRHFKRMHEFVATTDDLLKCNHLPKCLPHRGPVTDSFNGFCCKRYLVFLSLTELQAFQNFWHCHFKNNLILCVRIRMQNNFSNTLQVLYILPQHRAWQV